MLTMAAHGSPDRSQDAFVKVSFKGGSATTGSTTTGGAGGGTTAGGTASGTSGAAGGGGLPLTGPAGLVGAGVVGVALVGAGTPAVLSTRRSRGTPPTAT
ncbi:hypothetical protein [Embleya sp. NPDC005575]|uniref:hypothetical protein n=1 Tax=Embleya sp. NPDC005575 TaxID=3156892 RepID=UPI0033A1A0C5